MAKLKKMNRANLKTVAEKLQKMRIMSTLGGRTKSRSVPQDVKEGHFAVLAMARGEPSKRFIVPLSCLTHPSFQRLLEEAAEEYGFDQNGALTVPCRPSELEGILAERWHEADEGLSSSSSSTSSLSNSNVNGRVNYSSFKTMVQSY